MMMKKISYLSIRLITGYLKPANMQSLYLIAGIAPPKIRRLVAAQQTDHRHALYGYNAVNTKRLRRKTFTDIEASTTTTEAEQLQLWKTETQNLEPGITLQLDPKEELAPNKDLLWTTWRNLNRIRTSFGCTKDLMNK